MPRIRLTVAEHLRAAVPIIARREREYICHALADVVNRDLHLGEKTKAARFLASLGMYMGGAGFIAYFDDDPDAKVLSRQESQELRVTWLEFAADLAEEWGV